MVSDVTIGIHLSVDCLLLTLCACVRFSCNPAVHVCHLSGGCSPVCVGFESWSIICIFGQITRSLGHCCRCERDELYCLHTRWRLFCLSGQLPVVFPQRGFRLVTKTPKTISRGWSRGTPNKDRKANSLKNRNVLSFSCPIKCPKAFSSHGKLFASCWPLIFTAYWLHAAVTEQHFRLTTQHNTAPMRSSLSSW